MERMVAMKSLYELCQPRADVFEDKHQDDVLDLANLTEDSIDADLFFEETYFTDGMKQLVDLAFQRFAGIGATGLIRLKQAMGGGKTHNMITLGLLAKHPELREKYAKNLRMMYITLLRLYLLQVAIMMCLLAFGVRLLPSLAKRDV